MIPKEEFESAWSRIPGIMTKRHSLLVEGLVKWLFPETVLEIGCYQGCMTARIARALQENEYGRLVVIDAFCEGSDPESLYQNLLPTGTVPVIELVAAYSGEVPFPEKVDLAIIDGHHGTDECWIDVRKSADAGAKCICLHDTWPGADNRQCPGPSIALARLSAMGWATIACTFDHGFGVALRP